MSKIVIKETDVIAAIEAVQQGCKKLDYAEYLLPNGALRSDLFQKVTSQIGVNADPRDDGSGISYSDTLYHGFGVDAVVEQETALDALVSGLPTKDRVRLIKAARVGGYTPPKGSRGNQ